MENYQEKLGNYLLNRRKKLGIMQKTIADVLGVTTQAIYKYEHGLSYPDLAIIGDYANLLKTNVSLFVLCIDDDSIITNNDTFNIEIFSNKLKELRKDNKYTLQELESLIGVKYQTISKWERKESLPTITQLIKISKFYNISIDDLYYGKETNKIIVENVNINENKNPTNVIIDNNIIRPHNKIYPFIFLSLILSFFVITSITLSILNKNKTNNNNVTYANYQKYKILFDYGNLHDNIEYEIEENNVISKPDINIKGYTITSYTLNGNEYDFDNKVDNNMILKAVCVPNTYTIYLDVDNGNCDVSYIDVTYNDNISLPTCTKDKYDFRYWKYDNDIIDNNFIYNYDHDINIKAIFEPYKYTISFDVDGGNNIDNMNVNYNDVYDLPIPIKDGYNFYGWKYNDKIIDNKGTYTYDDNINLTALWKPLFVINFDVDDDNIDPYIGTSYMVNKLPTPTKDGYIFDGWKYNGNIVSTPFKYEYDDDNVTFKAMWHDVSLDFDYEIIDGKIILNNYKGNNNEVIIPSSINGIKINKLKKEIFDENENITNLSLPSTVNIYEDGCLSNLHNLESLSISDNINTSLNKLFNNNIPVSFNHITYENAQNKTLNFDTSFYSGVNKSFVIEFDERINTMPDYFLNNFYNAKEIIFNGNNLSFGGSSFINCKNLETLYMPQNAKVRNVPLFEGCDKLDNFYYDGTFNEFINKGYGLNCGVSNVYVKENNEYVRLENVTFDNINIIPDNALCGCTGITNVTIPEIVTSIGISAFDGCVNLNKIDLPDSIIDIKSKAFRNCTNLDNVIIPKNLNYISDQLFENCINMSSITLHDNITSIGAFAFINCDSLESIYLPDNIKTFGETIFGDCQKLSSIKLPLNLEIIPEFAFSSCHNLKNIILHDNIKQIKQNAFSGCEKLESITITKNVNIIEENVFEGSFNLDKIYYDGTANMWADMFINYYKDDPRIIYNLSS